MAARSLVDLLADLAHADVDRAVARPVRDAPDALLQLVAAHRAARRAGERPEQPELLDRQRGVVHVSGARRRPPAARRARWRIGSIAQARRRRSPRRPSPRARSSRAARSSSRAPRARAWRPACRCSRRRRAPARAPCRTRAERADSTMIGVVSPSARTCSSSAQPSVPGIIRSSTHDVGTLEAQLAQRAVAVGDGLHVEARRRQVLAHDLLENRIVLDDQHRCHAAIVSSGQAARRRILKAAGHRGRPRWA